MVQHLRDIHAHYLATLGHDPVHSTCAYVDYAVYHFGLEGFKSSVIWDAASILDLQSTNWMQWNQGFQVIVVEAVQFSVTQDAVQDQADRVAQQSQYNH